MALPSTDTLDVPSRALPASYVYNVESGPTIDTGTMDYVSRALPAIYVYVGGSKRMPRHPAQYNELFIY
jgi:hypothetical protein